MNTRVYAAEPIEQLVVYSTGGHKDAIVGSYFFKNSLNVSFCVRMEDRMLVQKFIKDLTFQFTQSSLLLHLYVVYILPCLMLLWMTQMLKHEYIVLYIYIFELFIWF